MELHKPVDCEYDSQEENSFDETLQNYQAHITTHIDKPESPINNQDIENMQFINIIDKVITQKWYTLVTLIIGKEYRFETMTLIDSGADLNCLNEGLVPTKYFSKTTQVFNTADGNKLIINYKLSDVAVCNNGICLATPFIMVKNLSQSCILGTPFLNMLYPLNINNTGIEALIQGHKILFEFVFEPRQKFINQVQEKIKHKENFLFFLKEEIQYKQIEEKLIFPKLQKQINDFNALLVKEVCAEIPNAFWERKQHIVELPYEPDFSEKMIPTKARPIQMNNRLLEICKSEI